MAAGMSIEIARTSFGAAVDAQAAIETCARSVPYSCRRTAPM